MIRWISRIGLATLVAGLLTSAAAAADAPAVGDRHVTFALTPTVESAYRVYVPGDWKPGDHLALVVLLHGGGGDENSPFDRGADPAFRQRLQALADAHHFILLSPRGHKGWWGARMLTREDPSPIRRGLYRWPPAGAITAPPPRLEPLSDADLALAEQDVFSSIAEVERTYGSARGRLYLMGNSMGSIGALHVVQVRPERWCAIAPSDGPMDPETYPYSLAGRLSGALFIHGDDDRVAPIESMRAIADGFERAGVPTRFLTVPGGSHSDSWRRVLPETFAFFDQHPCSQEHSK